MEERMCVVTRKEREELLRKAEQFMAESFAAEPKRSWYKIPGSDKHWTRAFLRLVRSDAPAGRHASQDGIRVVVDLADRTINVMVGIGCWKL